MGGIICNCSLDHNIVFQFSPNRVPGADHSQFYLKKLYKCIQGRTRFNSSLFFRFCPHGKSHMPAFRLPVGLLDINAQRQVENTAALSDSYTIMDKLSDQAVRPEDPAQPYRDCEQHTARSRSNLFTPGCVVSVSYTHLDVYKRQEVRRKCCEEVVSILQGKIPRFVVNPEVLKQKNCRMLTS